MEGMPKMLHLAHDVNNSGHQYSTADSTMIMKGVAPSNWPNAAALNDAVRSVNKVAEEVATAWGSLATQDRTSVVPPDFLTLAK